MPTWISPSHQPVELFFCTCISCPRSIVNCSGPVLSYAEITWTISDNTCKSTSLPGRISVSAFHKTIKFSTISSRQLSRQTYYPITTSLYIHYTHYSIRQELCKISDIISDGRHPLYQATLETNDFSYFICFFEVLSLPKCNNYYFFPFLFNQPTFPNLLQVTVSLGQGRTFVKCRSTLLQARWPFLHLTDSIKALKSSNSMFSNLSCRDVVSVSTSRSRDGLETY